MPVVASVDYGARLVYLTADCFLPTFDTMDVYRELREARRLDTLAAYDRRFRPLVVAGGNIPKRPGFFTQPYVQLLYGTRLVPPDQDGQIVLIRDTFDDTGAAGVGVFDRAGLTSNVDIDVVVDPVEVREIATAGGGYTEADRTRDQNTNDIANADETITATSIQKRKAGTSDVLVDKVVSGGGPSPIMPVTITEAP